MLVACLAITRSNLCENVYVRCRTGYFSRGLHGNFVRNTDLAVSTEPIKVSTGLNEATHKTRLLFRYMLGTVPHIRCSPAFWLSPKLEVTMPKCILIVDDSYAIRSATRHFLETQTEFAVCGEATDGIDAIEKTRHLTPDLIILDLAMPRMNGLEAARKLRAMSVKAPIILFTM